MRQRELNKGIKLEKTLAESQQVYFVDKRRSKHYPVSWRFYFPRKMETNYLTCQKPLKY